MRCICLLAEANAFGYARNHLTYVLPHSVHFDGLEVELFPAGEVLTDALFGGEKFVVKRAEVPTLPENFTLRQAGKSSLN